MLIALRCCSSDSATSSCQSSFCRSPSFYGPERGAHNSRNVRIFSSGFWQRLYDATCVLARRFSFPFKVLNRTYSWTRGVLQHFAIVMDKYGIYSTSQVPKRGEKPIVGQRRLLRPNLPAERRPPATRRRAHRGRPRSHGAGGGFPLGTPDQEWPTMPVLAHSGHGSFWWVNVTRGMEAPVFPRIPDGKIQRAYEKQTSKGGGNGRNTKQENAFCATLAKFPSWFPTSGERFPGKFGQKPPIGSIEQTLACDRYGEAKRVSGQVRAKTAACGTTHAPTLPQPFPL